MSTIIECLQQRGLIDAITSSDLMERTKRPITFYLGFDPTADSLHLGHWLGIMIMAWFQRYGHKPIVIVGGATGRIGDPSGKSVERPFLDEEAIQSNVVALRRQFEKFLDFNQIDTGARLIDNYDWLGNVPMLDFLRNIGRHFRVGSMLSKDSVKARLESEEGISFTEFSYQVLQAYDFYHLHKHCDVELQLGGSDQWGNITAGLDLIRKLDGQSAYGLTFPLLTRSDGKKFGKSEGGTVWLDSNKFSPYQLYQYLLAIPDIDVIKMLRMLTFVELEEIRVLEKGMSDSTYVPNTAQRRLAEEVTRLIHGEEGLTKAIQVTRSAAPGFDAELTATSLAELSKEIAHIAISRSRAIGIKVVELFMELCLTSSKGEAHRLIESGGAYINNKKIDNPHEKLSEEHLVEHRFVLLSAGKKKKGIVEIK